MSIDSFIHLSARPIGYRSDGDDGGQSEYDSNEEEDDHYDEDNDSNDNDANRDQEVDDDTVRRMRGKQLERCNARLMSCNSCA